MKWIDVTKGTAVTEYVRAPRPYESCEKGGHGRIVRTKVACSGVTVRVCTDCGMTVNG